MADADAKLVKVDKLPDSNFQQQNLKAWQPLLTPGWVVVYFIVLGLILVPLGVIALQVTAPVVETDEVRYDNLPRDAFNNTIVSINIPADMSPPIFFYYKLTDFYQNHRLYVKSRDSNQLKGLAVASTDLDTKCAPLSRDHNDKLLYPCGLIAQSYFTDNFSNPMLDNSNVGWSQKGISWQADREKFMPFTDFNNATMSLTNYFNGLSTIDHTAEDFMVWMRTSGLPTFMKLRYIINSPLQKGQIFSFTVNNVFDVTTFQGQKGVVLSTMSTLGGRNPFLGYFGIGIGCLCFLFAFGSGVLTLVRPRKLGDLNYYYGSRS